VAAAQLTPGEDPQLTAGERWTRSELARLRAARWTPAAVGRFMQASRRRARDVRAERPELARQARRWSMAGAVPWLVVPPLRRRAASGLASWGATALMLDWHLGMAETPDGRPRSLGPADAMTLVRAWLVPVAAHRPVPLVCAAALVTDGVDGALARATEPTRLGRDLEGFVDTAFALAAVRGAACRGWLGRGAASAEAARLVLGTATAVGVYFGDARAPDPALLRSARALTPLRSAGLLAAGFGRRRLANGLVTTGAAASLALTVGAAYRGRRCRPGVEPTRAGSVATARAVTSDRRPRPPMR
jgi:phosphatidylglycerophosphate synthase